ncbi:family 43 glycosylhydrolase [Flammeovirga sp. MY04]|uniref:family 43 glycosylhydrolase n=1 Tax=Flammeovirga sp. MY04 TaxID=1191459 RepID=UPI0008063BDB|nr:family 43 glycosylhydrolase [Flammeovirga sp. MY04]ANQ51542.1 family 43 glycosylhydrolase [Flammeovirga sp. MY04]
MNINLRKLTLLIGLCWGALAQAQNPFITHRFSADPTARVINDTLFVFPSSDTTCSQIKGNNGFCMPDYHVYSTVDLTNWTDHGEILSHNTVPWVEEDSYGMWAPDCIEKDGKYYFYFPAMPKDKSKFRRIGVAVADTPTGPYTPETHYIEGIEGIDPNAFIDDDGRIYLYYGGGEKLFWVELNQDMKTIKTKPQVVQGLPPKYKEGPFMFKRKGKYYFTFPHAPGGSEEIAYAVGDSPKGPFTYKGKVLERWKDGCWTNHHSFVEYKGEWFLFYHHMDLSGNKHRRSICADRVYFDEEGNIPEIKATYRGISKMFAKDAIQVDKYSVMENAKVEKTGAEQPNWVVKRISEHTKLAIKDIDFEKEKFTQVALFASAINEAEVDLFVGNKKMATFKIPKMKEGEWRLIKTDVLFKTKGMQDLNFIFRGNTEGLALDWIQFMKKDEVLVGKTPDLKLFNEMHQRLNIEAYKLYTLKEFKAETPQLSKHALVKGKCYINGELSEDFTNVQEGDVIAFTSDKAKKMYNAFGGFKASNFSDQEGVNLESCRLGGQNIGYIENGDYVMYNNLIFDRQPKQVTINMASVNDGGSIELRKNSVNGEMLARFDIKSTGGWQEWSSLTSEVAASINSTDKLFVVFKGADGFLCNLADIKFN